MEMLVATLSSLLVQLPIILVWIVGLVLALIYRQRHPKVSALAFISILGLFIMLVISTYTSVWLSLGLHSQGISPSQIGITLAVRGIVTSLISTVFWALLIAAIFIGRKPAGNQPASDEI